MLIRYSFSLTLQCRFLGQKFEMKVAMNPLVSPPPEIIGMGVEAILKYLHMHAEKKHTVYRAKVMIVGDPKVGKTALASSFSRKWMPERRRDSPQKSDSQTYDEGKGWDGIDISTYYFDITVSISLVLELTPQGYPKF